MNARELDAALDAVGEHDAQAARRRRRVRRAGQRLGVHGGLRAYGDRLGMAGAAARAGLVASDAFAEGKRQACRYFYHWELPKIYPQLDALRALDRTTLDMQADWF